MDVKLDRLGQFLRAAKDLKNEKQEGGFSLKNTIGDLVPEALKLASRVIHEGGGQSALVASQTKESDKTEEKRPDPLPTPTRTDGSAPQIDPDHLDACIASVEHLKADLDNLKRILRTGDIKNNKAELEQILNRMSRNIEVVLDGCDDVLSSKQIKEVRRLEKTVEGLRRELDENHFQNFAETLSEFFGPGFDLIWKTLTFAGGALAGMAEFFFGDGLRRAH